jgi:hypothetical protein
MNIVGSSRAANSAGCLESRIPSSLRVFISKEQTKENDDGIGSLFLSGLQNSVGGNEVWTLFVIAELLSETQVPLGTECR